MKRVLMATATAALLLAGCAGPADNATANDPTATRSTAAPAPGSVESLLAKYRLGGKTSVEVIDYLDRMSLNQRPTTLKASVRPDELVMSEDTMEFNLDLPNDLFYLSVAPYVNRTHDCFYHSLTTCKGELAAKNVQVKIVTKTGGKVLVDQRRTTFDNGFIGFWLPRDIDGTLSITYDGRSAETAISTGRDAPTCLTTLRLS